MCTIWMDCVKNNKLNDILKMSSQYMPCATECRGCVLILPLQTADIWKTWLFGPEPEQNANTSWFVHPQHKLSCRHGRHRTHKSVTYMQMFQLHWVKESSSAQTHRHIRAGSHKRVGHGVDELSAHSKVTELDLAAGVHQDVGGLDIWKERHAVLRSTRCPAGRAGCVSNTGQAAAEERTCQTEAFFYFFLHSFRTLRKRGWYWFEFSFLTPV